MVEPDLAVPTDHTKGCQQYTSDDGPGLLTQPCRVNLEPFWRFMGDGAKQSLSSRIEPLRVGPDRLARTSNGAGRPRIGSFQLRQRHLAQAVPRIRQVAVGFVFHPAYATVRQIPDQILLGHLEQWPDDRAPARRDPSKSSRACPANQLEQHRFRLIVE